MIQSFYINSLYHHFWWPGYNSSLKMHLNFFFFPSFFLFLLLINLIVFYGDAQSSFAVNEEINRQRFNTCSTINFECDDLQSNNIIINYPFWGNQRPDYCGVPDYKLNCKNRFTEIEINVTKYRVLSFDGTNKIIRIAILDFLDDACPSMFSSPTLNSTLFSSPGISSVSMFYGCPPGVAPAIGDKFKCHRNTSSGGTNDTAYFVPLTFGIPAAFRNFSKCDVIDVPVMETDIRWYDVDLVTVFRKGFELGYASAAAANFTFCDRCLGSGGQCGFGSTVNQHACFCATGLTTNQSLCAAPYSSNDDRAGSKSGKKKVAIGIAAGVAGVIITSLVMIITFCSCLKKLHPLHNIHIHSTAFWRKKINKNGHQNMEIFFENCGSLAPKRYLFSDVKKMTNSFEQKLGEGGFGAVFKGQLHDGMLVAVKVLFNKSERNGEDFINEVASISRTSHVNIVTLHGFCFEKKKMALIYEFMSNGSLEKFIYNKAESDQLGWETVYQISIGIARGLEYLHRDCTTQILHFDIKPHNVLLDQDFCPKISDFGLAKLCPRKESMVSILGARGTAGYIAPEVFSRNVGRVSYKSDVYSYGMMLLEMVGGRKNIDVKVGMDHSSQLYFPHWIYERLERNEDLGLHGVLNEEREELARKMIIVGLWCIQINPSSRPSMSKVLEMLEGTIEALQVPPKPMMLSAPTKSQLVSSSTVVSALQITQEPIVSCLLQSTSVSSSTIVSIS